MLPMMFFRSSTAFLKLSSSISLQSGVLLLSSESIRCSLLFLFGSSSWIDGFNAVTRLNTNSSKFVRGSIDIGMLSKTLWFKKYKHFSAGNVKIGLLLLSIRLHRVVKCCCWSTIEFRLNETEVKLENEVVDWSMPWHVALKPCRSHSISGFSGDFVLLWSCSPLKLHVCLAPNALNVRSTVSFRRREATCHMVFCKFYLLTLRVDAKRHSGTISRLKSWNPICRSMHVFTLNGSKHANDIKYCV